MIKALIVDDEVLARKLVLEYLHSYPEITVVEECSNGFEALKAIQTHQPDIVFLDVQMPKVTGIELLELLDNPPSIIFTTAYEEYAIQAFELSAVDYLLKPFSKERFDKAISKWKEQKENQLNAKKLLQNISENTESPTERIVIKINQQIKIIPINKILYIEASDDYVKIITEEGSFLKNKTMAFYEKTLPQNQFVRCHRSYIVNVQEISKMDNYNKENHLAVLRNGSKLQVSRSGYAKLRAVLGL